ncbi:MAG: hypothetical protein R3236_09430 [Phycisphaeraceae bacterium]|nr:hypothetical protein [Phycisphaeraceae bacterium]
MPRTCRECREVYDDDTKICHRCGIDLLTGRHLSTRIATPRLADDPDDDDPAERPWWYPLAYIPAMFPGLKKPAVLVVSVLLTVVGLGVLGLGLGLGIFGALIGGMIISGVGLMAIAQAVAQMIVGEIKLLPELLMEFESVRWTCFFVVMIGAFFGLYGLMKLVAASM